MKTVLRKLKALAAAAVLALALLPSGGAAADVYVNQAKPADWYERDLMTLTVMDFYQNDAFVLQYGGSVMLIDGGAPKHWEKMMEWLEERGLSHLDILFNTHPHDDHIGAQIRMLKSGRLTADEFISPFKKDYKSEWQLKMIPVLEEKGVPYRQILPGEHLTLPKAAIGENTAAENEAGMGKTVDMVLYRWEEGKDTNGLSGILWLHFGDATILLPADLSGEGEHWILEKYGPEGLKSDILKSPHHGIVRMVTDFLKAVDPALTIVTNGKNSAAKKQLDEQKYPSLCTTYGIITLETDGSVWYVTQEKTAN